jgi:lipoprotein-anchoring transpeptidase ErfK/SrfK
MSSPQPSHAARRLALGLALLAAPAAPSDALALPQELPPPVAASAGARPNGLPVPDDTTREPVAARVAAVPAALIDSAAPPGLPTPAMPAAAPTVPRTAPAAPARGAARTSSRAMTAEALRAPLRLPVSGGTGPRVLHVQVLLAGAGFSPGVLDGHWAANTRGAVRAFRDAYGLEAGETVDSMVYERLRAATWEREAVVGYTLTASDVRGPFRDIPASSYAKAKLDCLCHASVEERLAERFHTTPGVLRQLNPGVDLALATAGTPITVPNMWRVPPTAALARIVVDKLQGGLTGFDSTGVPLFWFAASTGGTATPSPTGVLQVRSVTLDPWYHYNPRVLKQGTGPVANLPPGPNSPVGTVWIQLSRAHIGIHGTPDPQRIGRPESNGCVRLTNWDARFLAAVVRPGVEVEFR